MLVAKGVGGIWFGVVRWRRCDWFCGGEGCYWAMLGRKRKTVRKLICSDYENMWRDNAEVETMMRSLGDICKPVGGGNGLYWLKLVKTIIKRSGQIMERLGWSRSHQALDARNCFAEFNTKTVI